MKTILLVDDENRIRKVYKDFLTREGYKVIDSDNVTDAREFIKADNIDLVLLDINMGDCGGDILYEVLRAFHQRAVKIIISSVYPREEQRHMIRGADDYFDKSESFRTLLKKVRFQLKEPSKKVVIIDDEIKTRMLFKALLEREGYDAWTFSDNKSAVQFLKKENNRVDLFVLDLAMPNIDGCYFFEMIRKRHPESKILVASNYPVDIQEITVFDADEYFDKTQSNSIFVDKVRCLVGARDVAEKK